MVKIFTIFLINDYMMIVLDIILFSLIIIFIFLVKYLLKRSHQKNKIMDQYKLNKIIDLINMINQDTSFDGILNKMYQLFKDYIPYSHIGIALLKDDGKTIEASYGISDAIVNDLSNQLLGIKANVNETSLGQIIKTGKPRVINDLVSYIKDSQALYNKIIIDAGIKSSITYPLKLNNRPVGIIFFSSVSKNIYTKDHISFLRTISNSMAISLHKNIFIEELLYSNILSLTKLAESKDEDTGLHLERMKNYSTAIAKYLFKDKVFSDLTLSLVKEIEKFSPMHDIGKVGIRDSILLKPGKLTEEEFKEMQYHTIYGAEVLKTAEENMSKMNVTMFKIGKEIALNHHEKWDGTGYPNQKAKEEIPLSARIVAVGDVFDALTSKRPYKEAFSFEKSFQIILNGKGKHFDPKIIDCLLKHKKEFYKLYKVYK